MKKVHLFLVLLLLEVYTATSKSVQKRSEAGDVKEDDDLKDLAKQLVKDKGSGYIDCENILVWDALLQEEKDRDRTIETCDLCTKDEFLKMHMELFIKSCGYGKGGFPSICFNPAGWENLLYAFKEEQLVKACALCDNGMFKRIHPQIFDDHCEDGDGTDGDEDDGEEEDPPEEEKEKEEDTRAPAEEEGGEDKEVSRETAESEEEDTRATAEEEGTEDKEESRETDDDDKEDTRATAEEEGVEDKEESRELDEEDKEDTRATAEEEGGEDKEESREVKVEQEDTRGDKLDLIDKGKDDEDLVQSVVQFVRDTAKNLEILADNMDRYEKKQKISEWRP